MGLIYSKSQGKSSDVNCCNYSPSEFLRGKGRLGDGNHHGENFGISDKTSITNTVVASSPNFDPNSANNSAIVTTQIFGNKK